MCDIDSAWDNHSKLQETITNSVKKMRVEAPIELRNTVSSVLLKISLDHSFGFNICLERHAHSSAAALLRPMFESFIRAAWIKHCALDTQVTNFAEKGNIKPGFSRLVKRVDSQGSYNGVLIKIWDDIGEKLHGLTHPGLELMEANISSTTGTIGDHFEDKSLLISVKFSAFVLVLTYDLLYQICEDNNDIPTPVEVMSQAKAWYPDLPFKTHQ